MMIHTCIHILKIPTDSNAVSVVLQGLASIPVTLPEGFLDALLADAQVGFEERNMDSSFMCTQKETHGSPHICITNTMSIGIETHKPCSEDHEIVQLTFPNDDDSG
jgi:hypothetical protein